MNLGVYTFFFLIFKLKKYCCLFCGRLELAQLEEAQLNEVKERERIARELADEQRLSCSFVELLNEHQLFDSFWTEDTDGAILMLIGEEVLALKEE